ncbi:MAG: hypothetical protein HOP12_13940, partial [Candidatus Eisenbacteria bacterium]|nr:hypothetical protein [Candidatus Eisenbacteria bacterium]
VGLFGILPLMPGLDGEVWQRGALGAGVLLAIGTGLGGELGARLVPLERRGLAWARLGPQPSGAWVTAKWLTSLIVGTPLVVLIWALTVFGLRLPPESAAVALATGLLALAGGAASGIWIGAAFGDPEWTNPRAMLRLAGRVLSLIAFVIQAAMLGLLILVPASNGAGTVAWLWIAVGGALVLGWTWLAARGSSEALDRSPIAE